MTADITYSIGTGLIHTARAGMGGRDGHGWLGRAWVAGAGMGGRTETRGRGGHVWSLPLLRNQWSSNIILNIHQWSDNITLPPDQWSVDIILSLHQWSGKIISPLHQWSGNITMPMPLTLTELDSYTLHGPCYTINKHYIDTRTSDNTYRNATCPWKQ